LVRFREKKDMKRFSYFNARTIDEAIDALKGADAAILAGGTDLVNILKGRSWPRPPSVLVNIKNIPELDHIREDGEDLTIGASTKLRDIAKSSLVGNAYPLLSEAARAVASPQVRNMGTIGGNICQETRCWYHRYPENVFNCLRKGGGTCYAFSGENRYHSIFGGYRVSEPSCQVNCPDRIRIPYYISKVREGKLEEAAKTLLECNPFPSVTGRVCAHFCQQECNRKDLDESVSIRNIERFVGDFVLTHTDDFMKPPERELEFRVAVVGSGPAGLSAAYYLRGLGYRVTVFEKMGTPGGMLVHAIPAYRLPKDIATRISRAIENMGVQFRMRVNLGEDITLESLRKDFSSVFLATGAWFQPSIGLRGENLTETGLSFLLRCQEGDYDLTGKSVVVIGGGNVAIDVAVAAKRLGAGDVTVACLENPKEMPAFDWEIDQAVEEGVSIMGSWGPSRILEKKGTVVGLELVRCLSVFDEQGTFSPAFDESTKRTIKAEKVIVAAGQKPDLSCVSREPAIRTEGGLISVDEDEQKTNVSGIFAGGDVTTGAASVIRAIAAGRRAAFAIDRHLRVAGNEIVEREKGDAEPALSVNRDCMKVTGSISMPMRPVSERRFDAEDALGLDLQQVQKEANRCFDCACVAVNPSDMAPALIALDSRIVTTKRTVAAEDFFSVGVMRSTVLDRDEAVLRIEIPRPRRNSKQVFLKFSPRKVIDFPIVSVAAVLVLDREKVVMARIALSGVAPIPRRFEAAEKTIVGKKIDEENAEAAGRAAVSMANPLPQNQYMVQIAQTMIKRAILACR
jgi:NADPH-dependent glutamate synthase beta subunit-like oxidoreductase